MKCTVPTASKVHPLTSSDQVLASETSTRFDSLLANCESFESYVTRGDWQVSSRYAYHDVSKRNIG